MALAGETELENVGAEQFEYAPRYIISKTFGNSRVFKNSPTTL